MNRTIPLLGAAALLASSGLALALPAIGLSGDRTLVMLDTDTPTEAKTVEIATEGRIAGIDWRPADGSLYAVTEAGEILQVDPMTGQALPVAATSVVLPLAGPVAMDFNPMADRLRLMSGTVNHRVHPDTGETTVDGALHFAPEADLDGTAPMIVATAYINSFGKPEATAQYNIDAGLNALVRQSVPNEGTLVPVGALGIPAAEVYALDIATDAQGGNTAWLVADGVLHTVSLEDGAVTASWPLAETAAGLRDFTVLSGM